MYAFVSCVLFFIDVGLKCDYPGFKFDWNDVLFARIKFSKGIYMIYAWWFLSMLAWRFLIWILNYQYMPAYTR